MQNEYRIPVLSGSQIRKKFIDFFIEKDHRFIRSATIAPMDDPTLLFTNSGMNQFKGIFLGNNPKNLQRVVNSQKCLRVSGKHNDLEEVGFDGTHHTFFEMLGNWSFANYYKREAITWAWELLTQVFQMPKERLFVTVHNDDHEAFNIWTKETDIDPSHIMRFDKENFWEMGPVGPCGPCSEINFDTGDLNTQKSTFNDKVLGVNGQNERYIEIWNLVFIQFERLQDGSLRPLADKHVDTGSGLERLCSVIQGKKNNYDTDLFRPIIDLIATLSAVPYTAGIEGAPHRVIADHLRALAFAIADGVTPGNEGRGYVMRRILRRASRYAHKLGQNEPFICKLVPALVDMMGQSYEELVATKEYIYEVIKSEETRFLKTLSQGLTRMGNMIKEANKSGQTSIKGEDVFLLHDTYGFPSDLTQVIAKENMLAVDLEGFEVCMNEQKMRARLAAKFANIFADEDRFHKFQTQKNTEFVGYEELALNVKTLRYLEEGDFLYFVFDRSPFYAEGGGQVGDSGILHNSHIRFKVLDTQKVTDLHVHKCSLEQGLIKPEYMQTFFAQVDTKARALTRRNHTATHLLHAALRQTLGEHVAQQGSYVGPDRIRFDFTHTSSLSKEQILRIEDIVNEQISLNTTISTQVLPFNDAKKQGAMALFSEKYDDLVRVLQIGSFSKELCGGTHAKATGEIGTFRIIHETSISSGVRRIEALTSEAALIQARKEQYMLDELGEILKTPKERLVERFSRIIEQNKEQEKTLVAYKKQRLEILAQNLISTSSDINGFQFVCQSLSQHSLEKEDLQKILDIFAEKYDGAVTFLTHRSDEQLALLLTIGKKINGTNPKLGANSLIQEIAKQVGGKGGGRADRARAGSKEILKETEVLNYAKKMLYSSIISST